MTFNIICMEKKETISTHIFVQEAKKRLLSNIQLEVESILIRKRTDIKEIQRFQDTAIADYNDRELEFLLTIRNDKMTIDDIIEDQKETNNHRIIPDNYDRDKQSDNRRSSEENFLITKQ